MMAKRKLTKAELLKAVQNRKSAIARNNNYQPLDPSKVDAPSRARAKSMYDLLIKNGASHNFASGVVANSHRETGGTFNPDMKQTRGPGEGIIQWEGPRKVALKAYAESKDKPWNSMETQVEFLMHELKTRSKPRPGEKSVLESLQDAKTPEEAAKIFHYKVEIDQSSLVFNDPDKNSSTHESKNKNLQNRMEMAKYWSKELSDSNRTATPAADERRTATPSADATLPQEDGDVFAPSATPSADQNIFRTNSLPDDDGSGAIVIPKENLPAKDPVPPFEFDDKIGKDKLLQQEDAPSEGVKGLMPNLPVSATGTGINATTVIPEPNAQDLNLPDIQNTHSSFAIEPEPELSGIPNSIFERDRSKRILLTGEDTVSADSLVGAYRKAPSPFEQVAHAFKESNSLVQAGEMLNDYIGQKNPLQDPVDPNWTAMNPEAVKDFPDKFWPFITRAKSPNDQEARRTAVRARMEDDEKYASGSFTWNLLGGLAGGITDPITYLIPMAAGFKSAKILEQVIGNAAKSAGAIGAYSLAHESLVQANKAGGNLSDLATSALADTVFGVALVGIGAGGSFAMRSAKLWETRRVFNLAADGTKVNFVPNEAGEFTGEIRATSKNGTILCEDI